MSFIKKALSTIGRLTGVGTIKDAAETIIGALKSDPDLEKALAEMELERENDIRDLYRAEVQQDDKFVKRARPSMIWLVFCIIGVNFILIPLINLILTACGVAPVVIVFPELPTEVYWLIASIFGLYTGARSFDKFKRK